MNIGVSILDRATGARIDPFYLGAKDESTVQGFAGTPVDVNALTYNYLAPVGAAGAVVPAAGPVLRRRRLRLATRSRAKSLAGRYVLRSWVNDVTPPSLQLLTTRVSAGRPTLVFRALDTQSGVDPASLTIGYKGVLVAVGSYDWQTGLAVFPLPTSVPALAAGTTVRTKMIASDYQEAKNIDTIGPSIMPNTRTSVAAMRVVRGVAVDWLAPVRGRLRAMPAARAVVAASAPGRVASVRFAVDGRQVAVDRSDDQGVWSAGLPALKHGAHTLTATAVAANGGRASARRKVRAVSRVAVVTGASSGIGESLARLLASRGWHCVLLARREERLRPLAESIGGEYELCDVADRASVERAAASVIARHPQIKLLVNNAGVAGARDLPRRRPGGVRERDAHELPRRHLVPARVPARRSRRRRRPTS